MKIEELHLLSSDVEQTALFYSSMLGFQIISQSKDVVGLQAGSSKLFFHKTKTEKPVYHFAFTVKSDLLHNAFLKISDKATMIPGTSGENIVDFSAWQAKAFYFFDNNGNVVECISRRPVDKFILSDEALIYSISEAGLVVDDVSDYAKRAIETFGLHYFKRQPKHNDSFTVLGDDNGLLILVPPGRDWYPTNIRSEKFWTKIKYSVGGSSQVLECKDSKAGL